MKNSTAHHPANILISTIMLFLFSAFLLLAMKDFEARGFLMVILVPLILALAMESDECAFRGWPNL